MPMTRSSGQRSAARPRPAWPTGSGRSEPGKLADLVVHDAGNLQWSPSVDPVMALVWGTDGRGVRDVFVGGDLVVRDGRSTRLDEAELRSRARQGAQDVLALAGIEVPTRWPVRALNRAGREALTHTAVRHNVS